MFDLAMRIRRKLAIVHKGQWCVLFPESIPGRTTNTEYCNSWQEARECAEKWLVFYRRRNEFEAQRNTKRT